jgi:hypothetical protein
MKKELMKSYIIWQKFAYSSRSKNDIEFIMHAYIRLNSKKVPGHFFEGKYCKKQLFKNLYEHIKIFAITNKIQADSSAVIHKYLVD